MAQETRPRGFEAASKLARTGKATIPGGQVHSFEAVQIPEVAVHLDASKNRITDFEGLRPPEHLKTLTVDNNPILSFKGIPETHNIAHFSALDTPITELPLFQTLALLAVGGQLATINGIPVTERELLLRAAEITSVRTPRTLVATVPGAAGHRPPTASLGGVTA